MSWWPILAAGFSTVAIGYVWFNPHIFGTYWMNASGIASPEMREKGKKRMPFAILGTFLAGMLIAYVMSAIGYAFGELYSWQGALELAIWSWLGFVLPTMIGMFLWELKPFRLFLINALHWLLAFIVIAFILLSSATIFSGSFNPDQQQSMQGE